MKDDETRTSLHAGQLHDQPRLPPGTGGLDLQIEDLELLVSTPSGLEPSVRGEVIRR